MKNTAASALSGNSFGPRDSARAVRHTVLVSNADERPVTPNDLAPESKRHSNPAARHNHPTWDIHSLLPVLVAWLIFYVIATVGALTETPPASVAATQAADRALAAGTR